MRICYNRHELKKKGESALDRHGRQKLFICVCCVLLAALLFIMPGAQEHPLIVTGPASEPASRKTLQTAPGTTAFTQEISTAAPAPAYPADEPSVAEETEPAIVPPVSEDTPQPETAAPVSETTQPAETAAPAASEEEVTLASAVLRKENTAANGASASIALKPGKDALNSLSSAKDRIEYAFSLSSRGVLHYSLSAEAGGSADFKVSLLQQYYVNGVDGKTALRLLNVLNVVAEEGSGVSPNIGLMPGSYVLRVESGEQYKNVVFRLRTDFTAGTDYEIEYNDTMTRYTEIYAGVPMKGSASFYGADRDTDWYLLRLYTPASVNLVFMHGTTDRPTAAFKVCLFTSEGLELYGGSALLNAAELVSGRIGLPAGNYFISVQSRVYSAEDYTLTVQQGSAPSESEPNDSVYQATALTAAQPLCGALVARTGNADKDYYAFTLDAPGYVNVWLKNDESAEGSSSYVRRLMVLDGAGHILFSELQANGGAEIRSPGIGLPAGKYYLCVNNDNLYLNNETYQVGFKFTPSEKWEREYNGERSAATPIAAGVAVSGTLTDAESDFDTDWFTFTVKDNCKVKLKLKHSVKSGENDIFNVSLYNADGKHVGKTIVSKENTETVSRSFSVAPGTYYVKVTAGKYNSSIRYYLTYSIEK